MVVRVVVALVAVVVARGSKISISIKIMLNFVTSNRSKFMEVSRILSKHGISVVHADIELVEIQDEDIEKVAVAKAEGAYSMLKQSLIVEDDGLFIRALRGFPGVYSSYVFGCIGNEGILKLLDGVDDRYAEFVSVIVYCSDRESMVFKGVRRGIIADTIRYGRYAGWGYDPIFIPESEEFSYAEMYNRKDELSHRSIALRAFIEWYKSRYDIRYSSR